MLDNDVSAMVSLKPGNIILRTEPPHVVELYVPWRRRRRLRRILDALRRIRRTHSYLILDQVREHMMVYIVLDSARELTMFTLIWPQDLPQWHEVDTLPPTP